MTYNSDIIIIGGGPAGLTSAIYALRAGKSVSIFDKYIFGGQTINTPEIENFPAFKNISGTDFALSMIEQVTALGANMEYLEVLPLDLTSTVKTVKANDKTYTAKSIIIANGVKRRKLECIGEDKFTGRGVSYCATCDGAFYKNKTVIVCGSGNTAIEDAIYLSNICSKVLLIIRGDKIKADFTLKDVATKKDNIEIIFNETITSINGDTTVESITTKNTLDGTTKSYDTNGVFVAIGLIPNNEIFKEFIALDEFGYIIANENCKTNIEGVFVAGDTRTKKLRQIVTASADGAISAFNASEYIDKLKI